jgi:hypothetical protein
MDARSGNHYTEQAVGSSFDSTDASDSCIIHNARSDVIPRLSAWMRTTVVLYTMLLTGRTGSSAYLYGVSSMVLFGK